MNHRNKVFAIIAAYGPLSDHGIFHVGKAIGADMTPSSVRSRRAELERQGYIKAVGTEPTGRGNRTARTFDLAVH